MIGYSGFISHEWILIAWGVDSHARTHIHTHTDLSDKRNQVCTSLWPAHTWFKNYNNTKRGEGHVDISTSLPHIIMNSWRPLYDLSHSKIIICKTRSPYQVILIFEACPLATNTVLLKMMVYNRTPEMFLCLTNIISSTVRPDRVLC